MKTNNIKEYEVRIANLEEMEAKWNYEINNATNDKDNWIIWKEINIKNFQNGKILPYYGFLNGKCICEATAHLTCETVKNADGLVGDHKAYLSSFRTVEKYQGKGYFSILLKYMLNDLKMRGFNYVTLGVEVNEEKNKLIYSHYGFTDYIKFSQLTYPNGEKIDVEFYGKKL